MKKFTTNQFTNTKFDILYCCFLLPFAFWISVLKVRKRTSFLIELRIGMKMPDVIVSLTAPLYLYTTFVWLMGIRSSSRIYCLF